MLDYTLTTLDAVAPELHNLYVERNGTFFLDIDADALTTALVPGLKAALAAERENNRAIKKLGRTPTEIAALIADNEAVTSKLADSNSTVQQREASWALERAELESKIALSHNSEKRVLRDVLIETSLDRAKATAEGKTILKDILIDRVRLDVANGKRMLTILGEDGAPKLKDGKPATMTELIADSIQAYPALFEGTGAGGGMPSKGGGRSGATTTMTKAEFDSLSPKARSAAATKPGFQII